MTTPWDVPGQDHAVTVLSEAVTRDEVAHAWAFVGPAGVGQQTATRWLAAATNCGAFEPPCGACDICRRCLSGVYPALWEFLPTGAFHRVDDVREQWLHTASRSLTEGRTKVLRIADADRMNEAAANAFLKGLEEPPPHTVWVLEITDPDELPDTILSRCRLVRFAAWPDAALDAQARALGMGDDQERGLAVRAAMGSPVQLERLAAPGGLDDLRAHRAWPALLREGGPGMAVVAAKALDAEIKRRTAALKEQGKAELEELASHAGDELPAAVTKQVTERFTRREREARLVTAQAAMDDLTGWLRDCLVVTAGGEPLIHSDVADSVRGDATALGAPKLLRAVDLVQSSREQLESNVQQGLALEALFLQLSALSY
jgi:DNA polymerase III subunit delta'